MPERTPAMLARPLRGAANIRAVGDAELAIGAIVVLGGHVGLGVGRDLAVGAPEEDLPRLVGDPVGDIVGGDIVGDDM
eukprot:11639083-Alexandrium_andersonii.AAC.1